MIKLDLQNAVTKKAIEKYANIIKKISNKMKKLETEGFEYLGWQDWPNNYNKEEFKTIIKYAKKFKKEKINTLVVIGIGGSFLGSKSAIKMIQGEYPTSRNMEIIFVGESISSTNLAQKLSYVQNKNFAINIISKSGTTLEPAIAFRLFKKLLEEKVGINNAKNYIVATTNANNGSLLKIAKENKYYTLVIPDNIGGRFSVLTSVGLFPMVCAGIDIKKVMLGAKTANKKFSIESIQNIAYRYAVARYILMSKFSVEMMVQYEPQMRTFNEWWKQLAGESEGKNQKGLLPTSAIFSTDLHSLGQFIQEGSKILFETVITIETPPIDLSIIEDKKNIDNLNYLTNKTISEINKVAFEATLDAHAKVGKVPNIHISLEKMNEEGFGQLVVFFQRAVAMTAYLQGVNPFNQPGVEIYKQNMLKILRQS